MWRTLDVNAVVEFLIAQDAAVVAGADGLDRTVTRARVLSAPADLSRVGSHELLIASAGTLIAADASWIDVISGLDATWRRLVR